MAHELAVRRCPFGKCLIGSRGKTLGRQAQAHIVCVWREQLRAWVSGDTWAEGLAIKKLWKYSLCLFDEAI